MNDIMAAGAVILLLCVGFSRMLYRLGVPALLIFMALGMLAGSDGVGGFYFDSFEITKNFSSVALAVIMFYGGFGTNWKDARPIIFPAALLSSLGTALTAFLAGLFCYCVLGFSFLEGMLIGSVISSTDAASVFSILKSQKLRLKSGVGSILEVESGSNDPFSYMLTVTILALIAGNSQDSLPSLLAKQIFFGIGVGAPLAFITVWVLRNIDFEIDGFYPIFVTAVAILAYSLSSLAGGNGFLSVYIAGMILGNGKIFHRRSLTAFLDGLSWLMQIALFFLLGLLSFPSRLPSVALDGMLIAIFLILIARPAAVFSILLWFKTPINQQVFISWVGIRGAASVVFAIYAVTAGTAHSGDIFHIVFFAVLFSILLQGTLVPFMAKKLNITESPAEDGLKSFTDYEDETYTSLMEIKLRPGHKWTDKRVMEAGIPRDILIVMIKRGSDIVVPKGSTVLLSGDILVLSSDNFDSLYM